MTYLLTYDHDRQTDFRAHAITVDPACARAEFLRSQPASYRVIVVERVEDLHDFASALLLAIFNGLAAASGAATTVNRFSSNAIGQERLFKLIALTAVPFVVTEPQPKKESTMSDTATTTGNRGRQGRFQPDQTVTMRVDANPKKVGKNNHARFQTVMDACAARGGSITVKEAIEAGATYGDLAWDHEKGYIAIA